MILNAGATAQNKAEKILLEGGVICIPTDTLYGICARALDQSAVERAYSIRNRDPKKPSIILISETRELSQFGIGVEPRMDSFLKNVWPGPVSVVFSSPNAPTYLTRGGPSLAFRLPDFPSLRALISKTGPLIAPSANPEGSKPAESVEEALTFFGEKIPLYIDGGMLTGEPSTLIEVRGNGIKILRDGRLPREVIESMWETS